MSASFNIDLLRGYFGGACCPVVKVSGRTFPVEEHFLEDVFELTGTVLEEDSRYAKRRASSRHSAKVKVRTCAHRPPCAWTMLASNDLLRAGIIERGQPARHDS